MKSAAISYLHCYDAIKKREKRRISTVVFAVFFTLCAVISPKTVSGAVMGAAEKFVRSALPVMLPFAVASGVLVKSGFGEMCRKAVGLPFRALLGIDGVFVAPFVLGAVAGFPIGAKTVCELYCRRACTREEAERALAICSNPGIGFTVAGVGGVLWNDMRFGVMAWIACLLASVTVGVIKKRDNAVNRRGLEFSDDKVGMEFEADLSEEQKEFSVSKAVTEAIREGANTMLAVVVFVAFFNAVSSIFRGFTVCLGMDAPWFDALINSFFEFSSGVNALSSVPFFGFGFGQLFYIDGALIAQVFTVAALAWSGVSVHMQTAGFTASCGLSMGKYYCGKLLSTVVAPLFFLLTEFVFRCIEL